VPVFDRRPVVAEFPDRSGKIVFVRHDRARIRKGTEVLPGVEAEPRRVPKRSGANTVVAGSMRLRRVFNDLEVVARGQRHERAHLRRMPVQMDRHDGPRARRDERFDLLHVHVEEARLDVDGHRRGPRANSRRPLDPSRVFGTRIEVVGERRVGPDADVAFDRHSVPELNAALDRHAVADHDLVFDEAMRTDVAVPSDLRIGQNDAKLPDFGSVSDRLRLDIRQRVNESAHAFSPRAVLTRSQPPNRITGAPAAFIRVRANGVGRTFFSIIGKAEKKRQYKGTSTKTA